MKYKVIIPLLCLALVSCNEIKNEDNSSTRINESDSSYSSSTEDEDSRSTYESFESQTSEESFLPIANPKIKNVIYLIADGLSSTTLDLARDLKKAPLYLDEILIDSQMVSTTNLNTIKGKDDKESTKISNTDSSSCGTALATGRKTYKNGQGEILHQNDNDVPYANDGISIWNNGEIERVYSILELAKNQNKKTAVITTADILDSTPSAFYSHSERGYWDTIYSDLKKADIDVIVGTNSYSGNSIATWENDFSNLGYKAVDYRNIDELLEIKKDEKFISIAESGNGNHNPFWDYNNYIDNNIRLFDYFNKTLELFNESEDGFFIMLEGGEIDVGGHNNVPEHAISEIYAFDEVCKQAIDYAYTRDDTLVVVTVDHGNSQYHYVDEEKRNSDFILEFDEEAYFHNDFEEFTNWTKKNITKNYSGHTLEDVLLGIFAPKWVEIPFNKETKIENIEIPRFIASLLEIDIDRENRILNGLEHEEEFLYRLYDFSDNDIIISKDEDVSDVIYWASDVNNSGFIDSSIEKMNDYENINSLTCYKVPFERDRYSLTGLTIQLKEPIDIKNKEITSLTIRLQISMDENEGFPVIKLFKNSNESLNDEGVSIALHCNSKVVDINLGNIEFLTLANQDGIIDSFTLGFETKSIGCIYLDELRFAYKNIEK